MNIKPMEAYHHSTYVHPNALVGSASFTREHETANLELSADCMKIEPVSYHIDSKRDYFDSQFETSRHEFNSDDSFAARKI